VVLVGEVPRIVLAVGVVEGAPQELTLVGQVPAVVTLRVVQPLDVG